MPNMVVHARVVFGAVAVFAGLASVAAPTPLQMAYARVYVGMKGCPMSVLDEVKQNPVIAKSTKVPPRLRVASHTLLNRSRTLTLLDTASAVWPTGSPDGGNLLHTAAMHGCYDIGMLLVVDFGLDPAEPAAPGKGMGGKTPYDLCVKAQAESEAAGSPDLCEPDYWLEVMEAATEHKQNGGCVALHLYTCGTICLSVIGVSRSRDL